MKLNMRSGELGIVVKGKYAGKIVRVTEYLGLIETLTREYGIRHVHWWKTDVPIRNMLGNDAREVEDYKLRPLSDSSGEDETFTWAGKPEEVKA